MVWLWAGNARGPQTDLNAFDLDGGKWLIFRTQDHIDSAWSEIERACEAGRLGLAKVSTRHPKHREYGNKHVICVYTDDSADLQDNNRIREVLREIGFSEKLHYKPDIMTLLKKKGSTISA